MAYKQRSAQIRSELFDVVERHYREVDDPRLAFAMCGAALWGLLADLIARNATDDKHANHLARGLSAMMIQRVNMMRTRNSERMN